MPDEKFTRAVLAVVDRIPPGRVMSYGEVGFAVGVDAPRAVGRVMALFGHAHPWWRVIRASGEPPQGHDALALPHYLAEGTALTGSPVPGEYRIARSARLPITHEIYALTEHELSGDCAEAAVDPATTKNYAGAEQ